MPWGLLWRWRRYRYCGGWMAKAVKVPRTLPPYRQSLAGQLLAAREAVVGPIRPILRDAGITEQQWRVLRVLLDHQSIELLALADSALLRPSSLTRILRDLVERGLVAREVDSRDARRSLVSILPAGRAVVDQTTDTTLALLDRYATEFGVDRLRTLLSELTLLTRVIAGPSGPGPVD
jgi:homoprotocatechuate degradation regulator HpaR